jgi:hypothetical protein
MCKKGNCNLCRKLAQLRQKENNEKARTEQKAFDTMMARLMELCATEGVEVADKTIPTSTD